MENQMNKSEIKIIAPEKIQSPVFSNIAQINVSDREAVIDFAFIQPNTNQGILVSRVVLSPSHAKDLAEILATTLENHEQKK